MNIHKLISETIHKALINLNININYKIYIHKSTKAKFGDYQINGIMSIAKKIGFPALELAKKITNLISLNKFIQKIEVIDPGFINIFLDIKWVEKNIIKSIISNRLGISKVSPKNIVIDYSSPNIAKEMHIGHVRSTIIGDASVRILSFLGYNVIKANHIGDWGTQFGMLIAYIEKIENIKNVTISISKLEKYYRIAKKKYEEDLKFAEISRNYVVKLQNGDKRCNYIWKKIVDCTMLENQKIYNLLNVTLNNNDIIGESFYKDMIPDIINDLKKKKLILKNNGALIFFLNKFKNKLNKPMGVILQKKDGSYLYTTTDIACIKYRCETLQADRIIYYIDSRQHQHLIQVWEIAKKAGYVPKSVLLEHHSFGMIFGKDNKPFKTRSGNVIKLSKILNESLNRTRNLIINRNPDFNKKEIEKLIKIIAIGSIKYADLSKNRNTDYIFDYDKMLSLEGNTALYIQYAYTRAISILNKNFYNKNNIILNIKSNIEFKIAVKLLQLEETIILVAKNGMPHILCSYLYDLAVIFSSFYENNSILNENNKILKQSRLNLVFLISLTLKLGLNLLGIETFNKI